MREYSERFNLDPEEKYSYQYQCKWIKKLKEYFPYCLNQ
jgi:hypothetical protein